MCKNNKLDIDKIIDEQNEIEKDDLLISIDDLAVEVDNSDLDEIEKEAEYVEFDPDSDIAKELEEDLKS